MSTDNVSMSHVGEFLPLLPLKDTVIFPQMILPVFVSEDICIRAVEAACAKDRFIFLSAFRAEGPAEDLEQPALMVSTPPPFDVYDLGTVASIMRTRKLPDGRLKVLLQGLTRGTVLNLRQMTPYPLASVRSLPEKELPRTPETSSLIRAMKELVEQTVQYARTITPDVLPLLLETHGLGRFLDIIAAHMNLKIEDAQKILGTIDIHERYKKIQMTLRGDIEAAILQGKSSTGSRDDVQKIHRENYLREQLKALKQELGEGGEGKEEFEEMRDKVMKAQMSSEGQGECLKQIRRLERMNQDSSEASLTRTYIDWMLDLPWSKMSDTKIEVTQCKKILDQDHYGLDKIKDRILEYMAVKKLNPNLKGPILCFVGPPGVGKTSLGKSIARAMGRKFARISLGGVKDESELRGHRRTYVGALPGRIIQALKQVGTKNPVFMLDEIDKVGADYKGDPASALLEILDPEQNNTFSDHYISVPFDLSQVIFLANANRLDTIPGPLRDRLEIIEVSGYSEDEKNEITKQYIIPKVVSDNGLTQDLISFQDSAVNFVIQSYTRESGLRNLEKNMAAITRKIARFFAENDEKGKERKQVKITTKLARELLGEEKYLEDEHEIESLKVGMGVGLAYTQVGGEVLHIEVKLLPGAGKLILTGQLGDVMKESVQAAHTCVRACAAEFGIDVKKFETQDVHLHVPAGAIPKDGPSAGIAIAVSLISAFRGVPLRQDVAMTGELTLQGRVLPIGGVREKCLAALRCGIRLVCLPEKNRGAFAELPLTVRRKMDVRFVSHLSEVLEHCLVDAVKSGDGVVNYALNARDGESAARTRDTAA